jgi:hypothetical protein
MRGLRALSRYRDGNLKHLLGINSLTAFIILSLLAVSSLQFSSSFHTMHLALAFKPSSSPLGPPSPSSNTPSVPSNQGPSVGCGPGTDNSTCTQSSNSSQSSTPSGPSSGSGGANNAGGFGTNQGSNGGNGFGSNNPTTGNNQQFGLNATNQGGFGNQPQQGANGMASPSSTYLRYRSPAFGFELQIPSTSLVTERPNGAMFIFGGGAIFVLVQNVNNMGLSDFTQYTINVITQTFPTARNGESGDSYMAGYPSHYLIFTTPTGVRAALSWTVVDNTGYRLGFFFNHPSSTADVAADQKILRDVASSFQVSAPRQG